MKGLRPVNEALACSNSSGSLNISIPEPVLDFFCSFPLICCCATTADVLRDGGLTGVVVCAPLSVAFCADVDVFGSSSIRFRDRAKELILRSETEKLNSYK